MTRSSVMVALPGLPWAVISNLDLHYVIQIQMEVADLDPEGETAELKPVPEMMKDMEEQSKDLKMFKNSLLSFF